MPQHPPRLIIVCGLPGTGKTTRAARLERELPAVRLCPDDWMTALAIDLWDAAARQRIEQLQWQLAQRLLSIGTSVVIEWGTWAKSERDTLRTRARALGVAVELHFLDAPVPVLYERLRARSRESPPIALADLESWDTMIERPAPEEFALFDAHVSDA